MTNQLDVLALSEEVDRDSKSGALSKKMLSQGNTLYGIDPRHPDRITRITPDGECALGYWKNSMFVAHLNLKAKSL